MVSARLVRTMLIAVVPLLPVLAAAASLSFGFSLSGSDLAVENRGGATAFYPAVFRIESDGRWRRLGADGTPAELEPGATLKVNWSDPRPEEQWSAIERMQPVMVRFFDQAGVGFGQISFFRAPPAAPWSVKAGYDGGVLQIEPPVGAPTVHSTWVLWAREEGIEPIRLPVRFEHRPSPALRIDWLRRGPVPFRLDAGAGQPEVLLIHETGQGYVLQSVPKGNLQGREQRAAWLDAAPRLYAAALIGLVIAASVILSQYRRRPRGWARR